MSRITRLWLISFVALVTTADDCHWAVRINSPSESSGGLHIIVRTVTTGEDVDADGYTLSVSRTGTDDSEAGAVASNGTRSFKLEAGAGNYIVELAGVAENCSVAGANPRTVDGETPSTTFEVKCSASS